MSQQVSDLSKEELTAIAKAVELWDELVTVLGRVEAYPRDHAPAHRHRSPTRLPRLDWLQRGRPNHLPAGKPRQRRG